MKITALLVSHNGARWLPQVMSALEESSRRPDTVLAVDTGSDDESVAILEGAFGPGVLSLPAETGYPDAVRAGLEKAAKAGKAGADDDEWVWLLHDDSAPDPDCLEVLATAAAKAAPEVAAVGPKLREWPSLRRLLEVGVTMSGTGRRETGLETGEYDQGQHDAVVPVLAVNTAGMLVRRRVLEEVGLDPELPIFANDIDFGWRLARRGLGVHVEPAAVMFHVEAAHRGIRRGRLVEHHHREERAAAIYTVLANGSRRAHPIRMLRFLIGGLLRALGFLLVRDVPRARAELAAVEQAYARPGRISAARKTRRQAATVSDAEVAPLLAPWWMPWRHGLDFVTDFFRAVRSIGRDELDRRRDEKGDHRPLSVRLVRSPAAWSVLASIVLALVAARSLYGGGPLHGGALLPAPGGPGHWWSLWAQSWHWVGGGTGRPAPAYLLPLAVIGTVLIGKPSLVIWFLFVLTVPLCLVGALRFLRRITTNRWIAVLGAIAYALLPVLSGAVAQGRLGTVAGAVLLPWLATAALGLDSDDEDRRARALWRTALIGALLVAFVPFAIFPLLLLVPLGRFVGITKVGPVRLAAIPLAAILFSLPWLPVLAHAPGAGLLEAGRPAAIHVHPSSWDLLAGVAGGPGSAPFWLTVGLAAAALLSLIRTDTRTRVARLWLVALGAALCLTVLLRVTVTLPAVPDQFHPWAGFWLVVLVGAFITAVVVAADGNDAFRGRFGWRQPVAGIAAVLALVAPVGGTAWWLVHGTGTPLHRSQVHRIPGYMAALGEARHADATLVLTGGPGAGHPALTYKVMRSGHEVVGDDGVLTTTPADTHLATAVGQVIGAESPSAAHVLAAHGITYVYAPKPVSGTVAGSFDATAGFTTASAPHGGRAWRISPQATLTALAPGGSWVHPLLIALQLLVLLGLVVLAAPSRKEMAS